MSSSFKLGILSDTHGCLSETQAAIQIFREQGVTKIIHCGDIGGAEIVWAFQGIETHFVFGNTDGESELLQLAVTESGNFIHGWFGSLEWEGKRIFFLHGHQNGRFETELNSGHWDLICYGHTHFPQFQIHRQTLLLNPGAFKRVRTPSIAVVTVPELSVESFAID